MIATTALVTGGAAAGFVIQPESAQAASKRRAPPPTEEKPAEEKNLSALDAKKLANIRRKEALQAQLEKTKEKAKTIREPTQAPIDMFGSRGEAGQTVNKVSEAAPPVQAAVEAFSQVLE
jgi:hypothetical protein